MKSRPFTLEMMTTVTALLGFVAAARSQSPATQPASPAPLLQQISDQTQSLYASVRPGLVMVNLPPPRWVGALMDPNFNKWAAQLDPNVRQKVEAQVKSSGAQNVEATISPTTQPSATAGAASAHFRVVQRADGGIDLIASPPGSDLEPPVSGPNSLGLILDDEGHVLVPAYIEKESVGERGLRVYLGRQKVARATFVGSDQKTNLSVLKLDKPVGKPVQMLGRQPNEGSLVMVLLTNGESGELLIWTGGLRESGAVVTSDGSVAGFSRAGVFLSSDQIRPVVDQLVKYGVVKRAVLGVWVRLVEGVGEKPALRVERIFENSPAASAGIKVGDMIVSVAGASVTDLPSFAAAITAGNGPTELGILREGNPMKLTVDLKPQ